jgi:ubiquinone/menaquinone biosynthesis C-methylase UbiE
MGVKADHQLKGYILHSYENMMRYFSFDNKMILEIGCGNGALTRYIAQRHRSSAVIGIDPGLGDWWKIHKDSCGSNWSVIDGDGQDLQYADNIFDIVFSLACFEHIPHPDVCLAEIKRVLKPGGHLYVNFSPIWTCIVGHHHQHWVYSDVIMIPPWGHLVMDAAQMRDHLMKSIDGHAAEQICKLIYDGTEINRHDIHRLRHDFRGCGMEIMEWKEPWLKNRAQWSRGMVADEMTDDIYEKLKDKYTKEDLYVCGLQIHMMKSL